MVTPIAVITQTPRFRAALMRGGMGDLVAMTGTLWPSGFAYGIQVNEMKFGGTIWQRRDVYLNNSPIYDLERVSTPLLIVHGEGGRPFRCFWRTRCSPACASGWAGKWSSRAMLTRITTRPYRPT